MYLEIKLALPFLNCVKNINIVFCIKYLIIFRRLILWTYKPLYNNKKLLYTQSNI